MSETANKRKLRTRRALAVAAVFVFVLAAALTFYFRNSISPQSHAGEGGWRLSAGSSRVYGACGNSLVSASSTGVQVFDKNGAETAFESFSMGNPSVCCTDSLIAVWDTGGTALRIADAGGEITAAEPTGEITAVSLSESGHLAVLAAETGWKGVVTVYDRALTPVYRWYSGTDYPVAAEVSPDGGHLAVITASASGGRVRLFSLDSEQELGTYLSEDALFTSLGWVSRSECCAITSDGAVFLSTSAEETGSYDFGGLHLGGLDFGGDGFVTVALAKYLSAEPNTLVTLGASGAELGRLDTEDGIVCFDALGSRVLCCTGGEAALYSQTLGRRDAVETQNITSALLLKSGNAIVIGGGNEISLIRF